MVEIRESPFKVDKIENDPHAFGNRPREVIACVESLLNNRYIIISGPRGIGKSSLAYQIQNFYKGDYTLARRCNIETELGNYLTCFYACDKETTLGSLALDLIHRIENECVWVKSFKTGSKNKFQASINLGVVKAGLQTEIITNKPSSVLTQLVNGLKTVYNSLINYTNYDGINILIDELDQINENINFGHFLKILHEYLVHDELDRINFIFAGQKGIFTHLFIQDPSIERIIKHVPISKLESEECKYILNYASSKKAKPPFTIKPDAEELILKISSGFPYAIQLLGDAAFSSMRNPIIMTQKDVLTGIEKILKLDKNEKYYSILNNFDSFQRKVLMTIARYRSSELPMTIPFEWILTESKSNIKDEEIIIKIYKSLGKTGHLIINEDKEVCQFNDELFRIFLSLIYLEAKEEIYEKDKIDFISISDPKIKKVITQIEDAEYRKSWERDQETYDEIIIEK
jgi:hypothetical protein